MTRTLPAPLARSNRVTHPEDRLRRAAPRAAEFRFPSVWKRTENKPGRQRSPRASGFLEDTAASPEKAAAAGTPRKDSHFFSLGCPAVGAARPVGWGPGGSGRRANARHKSPSRPGRRPVTQQHARETRARRHPPRQRPPTDSRLAFRAGEALYRGGWKQRTAGSRAPAVLKLDARAARANRKSGRRELTGHSRRHSFEGWGKEDVGAAYYVSREPPRRGGAAAALGGGGGGGGEGGAGVG